MDAQGALDSLLGRLTTILVEEAQLLGRVRGDVEFIKEEMECMNSLILQLTEAQYRDHLVRAWMKQVVGLTRDCEGNVTHYIHYVGSRPGDDGLLGYLRRVLRFVRTIPVRHRLAMRIRELKVHARDVGDRRQRYGVTVPASTRVGMNVVDVEPSGGEEDLRRRAVLLDDADEPPADEEVVRRGVDTLVKCLSTEPPATTEDGVPQPQVRVFCILGEYLAARVAHQVHHHSSVATLFDCKVYSSYYRDEEFLGGILEKVEVQIQPGQEEDEETNQAETSVDEDGEKQLITKIRRRLKGKRFLVVVVANDLVHKMKFKHSMDAIFHAADGCLPGSSIIISTEDYGLVLSFSPCKIINVSTNVEQFYSQKARDLNAAYWDTALIEYKSAFARKMLLHLLYVKPTMTEAEKGMFNNAISMAMSMHKSIDHTMVMLCYNELPSKYRSCLLHLTIFPQGHVIRTTRLARRWIAEGLVTTTSGDETESEADKAGHYWDVLFIRGFISPVEISAAGNIKSFTLKDEVHKVIAKIAREVNIVDTNLPIVLARHLSIHNRIVLPKSHSGGDSKDIAASLPSLATSPEWKLLKVLDLKGCHSLEKQHLKSICKILLLKYLSLRNTDVTELPKQIKELQCLETLDVRETKVRVLAKKVTVLPLLKHFLAGHRVPAANDSTSVTPKDSISAVQIPLCIEKMNNMEILSHVRVSNSKELGGIAQLLKLGKLGVALHGKHAKLSYLFSQIEKLHRCLRSLSIRIDPQGDSEIEDVVMPSFIERLNISGITGGLGHLIQEHHKLTKITLCEAQLKEDDLSILGKLGALHCLRLLHNSYSTQSEIAFRGEEFQSLNYLLVEGKDITKIRFASGAAPKLERIVWSFARIDALSGLHHLTKLKELELNGDRNLDPITHKLAWHPNEPTLKHKPHHQCQEDRTAAPTS